MGKWLVAADGLQTRSLCSFGRFLAELPSDERADWDVILERANGIEVNRGRYAYVIRVAKTGGGKAFDRDTIRDHLGGECLCHVS